MRGAVRSAKCVVRRVLLVLPLLLLAAAPLGAQAPEGRTVDELPHANVAEEAISRLRSPYCPGLMLEVCPSEQAGFLRDSIRALAAQGKSADWLVEWMISRHGEEWRALPKRSGPGVWAWVIPPLVLLAGGAVVVERLRRARADAALFSAPAGEISDAERERVAAALREWERTGEVEE